VNNVTADRDCPLCGGKWRPYWRATDHAGHGWDYEMCAGCGWTRLVVDPASPEWQRASYSPDYYGGGYSKFAGAIQLLRRFSAWRRAREINGFFRKPGRALDIGCGEGLFLECMQALQWTVAGCEIGETAARRAEERVGPVIHRGEFETMPPAPSPWDVVMLWHVLEHVAAPADLLRRIHPTMSSEALLVIAIPNADSWQAGLFGPHWFHLDPPRHLHHLGADHLRRMASQAGFEEIESHHFSLEYNPFGWAQSLLNAMGWRRDAMYERLKTHIHPPTDEHPSSSELKWGWLYRPLAWLLLVPSILPAILESAVGRGGTVVVYFRKEA
jgi:2-polyprenyl-3-methyl-5-hydroxy-6-metoxy-1,4-benzoquinol methylase